jgi:hypothetical protein
MRVWPFAATALSALAIAAPAAAQDSHAGHRPEQPAPASQPNSAPAPAPPPAQDEHAGHQAPPASDPHAGHDMTTAGGDTAAMTGALGAYGMGREASGTAWQPEVTPHAGIMRHKGDWMLMGHVVLNGVYDWQEGPRGAEKSFVSGMVMGMAQKRLASGGKLQLRAMMSPDPFMGKRGYPILLASGETADGVGPLIDRQHPHDLFMELSASLSHPIGERASVFLYGGLPGEPAFGPPAFMHRLSILDSPEAPISHHWLDSTHITWGVLTAGVTLGDWSWRPPASTGASRTSTATTSRPASSTPPQCASPGTRHPTGRCRPAGRT